MWIAIVLIYRFVWNYSVKSRHSSNFMHSYSNRIIFISIQQSEGRIQNQNALIHKGCTCNNSNNRVKRSTFGGHCDPSNAHCKRHDICTNKMHFSHNAVSRSSQKLNRSEENFRASHIHIYKKQTTNDSPYTFLILEYTLTWYRRFTWASKHTHTNQWPLHKSTET